jgi:GTPase SAR1 family protein
MENQQQKEQLDGTKTRELCSFNIVVVGDSEVGKSSLLSRCEFSLSL